MLVIFRALDIYLKLTNFISLRKGSFSILQLRATTLLIY